MADFHHFRNQSDRMRTKSMKKLWTAALSSCLGSMAFGYMIGYISPAVPDMEWQGVLDKTQLSWFSSLVAIGAIPGCIVCGQLLEHLGRKWTIVVSAIPYILGWSSILIASASPIFYIGRLFTGFATGIVSTAVPVYLSEISTKDVRGLFGALNQLGITFGILLAYACGLACGYWYLTLIGLLISMLYPPIMMCMPQTPRWLIQNQSRAAAKQSLVWLRDSHVEAERELSEMDTDTNTNEEFSLMDFLTPELSRPLIISVGLMVLQQLSGINAVMFNIVDIFLDSGFRESGVAAATIVGVVQFVATIFGCLIIEKYGRRYLLITTGIGMATSCFMFASYYHLNQGSASKVAGYSNYLPLLSLSLFIIAFSLGWGPIPSIIMSEIFPTKARSSASSITVVSNWIFAFLVTKNYIFMSEVLGKGGVFAFFGMAMIAGMFFVQYFIPETRGKSFEEIQGYFGGGKSTPARKL